MRFIYNICFCVITALLMPLTMMGQTADEEQNAKLVTAIVFLLGALLVALLAWTIWRRVKLTRKLRYELDLKRDFVNNLAKRLRTPLNPITGFSNILASGMDLAICKSVTKLLGGDIWLDESYTNGSRFVFEIPKE